MTDINGRRCYDNKMEWLQIWVICQRKGGIDRGKKSNLEDIPLLNDQASVANTPLKTRATDEAYVYAVLDWGKGFNYWPRPGGASRLNLSAAYAGFKITRRSVPVCPGLSLYKIAVPVCPWLSPCSIIVPVCQGLSLCSIAVPVCPGSSR